MAPVLIFPILLSSLLVAIRFFSIVFFNKKIFEGRMLILEVISVIIAPATFLFTMDWNEKNDCCSDSAFFSPEHRISIYILVLLCVIAYFILSVRKNLFPPLSELLLNCFLVIGLALNVLISFQHNDWFLPITGNVPIIMLYLLLLRGRHKKIIESMTSDTFKEMHGLRKIVWNILQSNPILKFPVLLLLCLPILVIVGSVLLITGQKPDSMIRAFTDTYKHGFSQLDYQCKDIVCDGHYLCTIAAKGHRNIVRPERYGYRGGRKIICNRQLLISNAFEELLQQHIPSVHKPIRRFYNRIGNYIHRYYSVFDHKWFSDLIYILMKPLEWIFLAALYLFDKAPEKRIARQYLK